MVKPSRLRPTSSSSPSSRDRIRRNESPLCPHPTSPPPSLAARRARCRCRRRSAPADAASTPAEARRSGAVKRTNPLRSTQDSGSTKRAPPPRARSCAGRGRPIRRQGHRIRGAASLHRRRARTGRLTRHRASRPRRATVSGLTSGIKVIAVPTSSDDVAAATAVKVTNGSGKLGLVGE